eukprot:1001979-Lingulodinium_polyedra.AAC.1
MMRLRSPSAAAAACNLHASPLHANAKNRRSRGVREVCDSRAAAAADGRFDRILAHGFKNHAQ